MPKRFINYYRKLLTSKKYPLLIIPVLVGTILVGAAFIVVQDYSNGSRNDQARSATDVAIENAQKKLDSNPDAAVLYADLCQSYLEKVKENADTSYYGRCDDLFLKANRLDLNSAEVSAAQAAVAYGRHSFERGLEFALRARELNPDKVSYYGLVGDGQLELGQYDAAVQSFQTMIDKKPELGSYNRVAYVRELYGDIDGARAALESAIAASSSNPVDVAYTQVELGKLHLRRDLGKAEASFEQALRIVPDYPPALEGMGKVAFARQDYDKAQQYFQKAFDELPLSQYASALGDTYSAKGDIKKADAQYFLAQLAFDKSNTSGVNNDYELALFLTNRAKEPERALRLAQASVETRPNSFSYDVLAWAQFHLGDYAAAKKNSQQALQLGKHPFFLYHAAMIAEKLGQKESAKIYLEKAFTVDHYLLETHFSLLDRNKAHTALERLK